VLPLGAVKDTVIAIHKIVSSQEFVKRTEEPLSASRHVPIESSRKKIANLRRDLLALGQRELGVSLMDGLVAKCEERLRKREQKPEQNADEGDVKFFSALKNLYKHNEIRTRAELTHLLNEAETPNHEQRDLERLYDIADEFSNKNGRINEFLGS
jgi:hypothetical protein